MRRLLLPLILVVVACHQQRPDEDGSRLWLRMDKAGRAQVGADSTSATVAIAIDELTAYWTGQPISLVHDTTMARDDGFAIDRADGCVTLRAATDAGLLYGAYDLLRRQQTGAPADDVESHPSFPLRILNHWDNLDGTVERGYAGVSILWHADSTMPSVQVLTQYARANASIGINATVLNNVNASPRMLSAERLDMVRRMADVFRPYGLRVFLSVNFASPIALDSLPTADPLDPRVRQWWSDKADEIYRLIPDFGGFLVKANSEGQPGPGDYGRTHADGANMMADALMTHGGTVMWRAFVYGYHDGEDRVKKAVNEFRPLDGEFRPNVILQIKNGPLDFQPREPYSPLFDQMHRTPMMAELQITQEYTGQSRHLVFLAPMWHEFFDFVSPRSLCGVAGVANIGDDANWCGHHFSQANWYAFGRMAWDAGLTSQQIAREWLCQTFSDAPAFVDSMAQVMETSHEACVDYMMPLGLHHIFKGDHHYGPEPEGNQAHFPDEWKPVWYHKADSMGIGFNRSSTGTDATSQYRQPFCRLYDSPETCPDQYLLWFHHLPWDYTMKDGSTLWQSLCAHYDCGVSAVDGYVDQWQRMQPYVDRRRHDEVLTRLRHQQQNAREWRDHCLGYFSQFSRQPF